MGPESLDEDTYLRRKFKQGMREPLQYPKEDIQGYVFCSYTACLEQQQIHMHMLLYVEKTILSIHATRLPTSMPGNMCC